MPSQNKEPEPSPDKLLSSPMSTGGLGSVFEMKVQSGLLASLLVRAHLPFFDRATICELQFQSELKGYATDDVLVVAEDLTGGRRRQLWTIKHKIAFTEKDSVFQKVIRETWSDFSDPKTFTTDQDAIVLATATGSTKSLHVVHLLESVRASLNPADFDIRLRADGVISKEAKAYYDLFFSALKEVSGDSNLSDEVVWRYLHSFHWVRFDFDQIASQNEACFKTMLSLGLKRETSETGESLWNRVFKWVADKNPRAGNITWESLPVEWHDFCATLAHHYESGVISRLIEHSKRHLARVQKHIGKEEQIQVERRDLIRNLADALEKHPVTVVSGPAGTGKSAATFMALDQSNSYCPCFVFQAREFACTHIDEALGKMRINEPLSRVSAAFALHPRKFLIIESAEHLLESPENDAFYMLLEEVVADPTWHVVITTRSHAAVLVVETFLRKAGNIQTFSIPLLADVERDEVLEHFPILKNSALDQDALELLRNPWYLDAACSINWAVTEDTRINRSSLREILWKQVVAKESFRRGGIHLSRERVFREIAINRARTMKSFVASPENGEAAVQQLIADDLLIESEVSGHFAPSHDVWEDWALIMWVGQEFERHGKDVVTFFKYLGYELPIRRAYRNWLNETLLEGNIERIREHLSSIISNDGVEQYWKDEVIVSILSSEESLCFLDDYSDYILREDCRLLRRMLHLLRTACKKPNPYLILNEEVLAKSLGDLYLVPDGPSWGALVGFIHHNMDRVAPSLRLLLIGFLEDYKSGIGFRNPKPLGYQEAFRLALRMWDIHSVERGNRKLLERLAKVIFTIPYADTEAFRNFLTNISADDGRSPAIEAIKAELFGFPGGTVACHSFTSEIASFCRKIWELDRKPSPELRIRRSSDIDIAFGLENELMRFYPPSRLQGPFGALLSSGKPDEGIDLILDLVNHCTLFYTKSWLDRDEEDDTGTITLVFDSGNEVEQFCHPRLWLLYRGGMPGPNLLESALAALEHFLLAKAKLGESLEELSQSLILRSNSIATTAVIASVAMAYPHRVGRTGAVILQNPEFFQMDQRRYMHDQTGDIGDHLLRPIQKIHYNERKESRKLAHRTLNLESLAVTLQGGELKEEVWKTIDNYKTEVSGLLDRAKGNDESLTDSLETWQLRLHRMDIRNFVPIKQLENGETMFAAGDPGPALKAMRAKKLPEIEKKAAEAELLMWGMALLENPQSEKYDTNRWREMLALALETQPSSIKDDVELISDPYAGGSAYVAAVCLRDHLEGMPTDDVSKCLDILCCLLEEEPRGGGIFSSVASLGMSGHVAAAQVLPCLVDTSTELDISRVKRAVATAITHFSKEVRVRAAKSIRDFLWGADRKFAESCLFGVLHFAQLRSTKLEVWRELNYQERGDFEAFIFNDVVELRRLIYDEKIDFDDVTLSLENVCATTFSHALMIASSAPRDETFNALVKSAVASLVTLWQAGEGSRRGRENKINYEEEQVIRRIAAGFIVGSSAKIALEIFLPCLEAFEDITSEIADFFKDMISSEDRLREGDSFWAIWQSLFEQLSSKLNAHNHQQLYVSEVLLSALFLDVSWKQDALEWTPLHGREKQIKSLVCLVGSRSNACGLFIRLLSGVGNFMLPNALHWLADSLRKDNPHEAIQPEDCQYNLVKLLTPLVYGKGAMIRRDASLQEDVIFILNAMVDNGSSAAFRMRDYLVSPLREQQPVD